MELKKQPPKKWDTISFREHMADISPDIQIIGDYTKMSDPIECRCTICGNTWYPLIGNVIRGTGCPQCRRKKSYMPKTTVKKSNWTKESFSEKIAVLDPNIELMEEYKKTNLKIKCRCKVCKTEWSPTANNLLQGRSHCPFCSKKTAAQKSIMTEEEYNQRVVEINDSVEIIGSFTGVKKG